MKKAMSIFSSAEVEHLFSAGSIGGIKRVHSEPYHVLDISANCAEITGFTREELLGEKWMERIHPSDREIVFQCFKSLQTRKGEHVEYRFKRKNGWYFPLREEVIMHQSETGGFSLVSTFTKMQYADNELLERLAYQEALSKCSSLLIDSSSDAAVQEAMRILLHTAGADRIYMFTCSYTNGELLISQREEVCREGVKPEIDNPDLQNMPFEKLPWVFGELRDNRIVNIKTRALPEAEREFMLAQEINSLLLFPVFIEGEWFGFLGFDTSINEKKWEDYEINQLKTASELMGIYFKRVSLEGSFRNQKSFTQQILNSLPSITVVLDENFKVLQWNKMTEALTGYSKSEILGMSAFNFIISDEHREMEAALSRLIAAKNYGQELHLINKYGGKTLYHWRGNAIKVEEQTLFVIIGVDVTSQKEMEMALLEEKRFAEAIINTLPGIFFMVDEDQNYVKVNQNFLEEFGYSPEELKYLKPTDFYSDEELPILRAKMKEVYKKGSVDAELNRRRKDGSLEPYYLKAVLFQRNNKNYVTGTGYSILNQKLREDELKASLHEKQVLLQEIHHRVKNNLAVISGLLELQINEHNNPELKRLLEESQRRIQTMAIIHEKLYQSERLSRIPLKLYVNDLIEQIGRSFSISDRNIRVETSIKDTELNINQAIPFALALNEIISNAFEHAFKGRKQGVLSLNLRQKKTIITADIKDDGVGFNSNTGEARTSLGLTLIHALLSQINADWEMHTENGVHYHITFRNEVSRTILKA